MLQRVLEQRIENARKKMEDTAIILGLGHPRVYQLSQELDRLHNQWEKEYGFEHKHRYQVQATRASDTGKMYKIVV